MFIVSFFLPATNRLELADTPAGTPLNGWQAFTTSLFVLGAQPFIVFAEPSTLHFLRFPFINVAMLLAPLVCVVMGASCSGELSARSMRRFALGLPEGCHGWV